tara:strand:+ start:275 stop:898 length:624 start_codon:yes stop_codon:yes gene_type:complete
MQIEWKNIKDVKPYKNNPRANNPEEKVARSIEEFGWQQPIVVDMEGVIIAGHTRYGAAKHLGLDKVPVVVADLPEDKANAYRIADNRTNEDAEWDFAKLTGELTKLQELDFDLDLLGFEESELESMLTIDNPNVDWLNTDDHWKDMPEFVHEDQRPARTIFVHFRSEEDVADFCKAIKAKITDKTKSIWHPPLVVENKKDQVYDSKK